ncbi:MAG: dephospho-CoA kinase [Ruminococcus sp.]
MARIKIIGLTGQSGAGKSTAARLFEENGFTVINADTLVRNIYTANPACLKAVAASFGQDIILPDGTLDRRLLASRAFATAENTALLGALVHPFVLAETLKILKNVTGCAVLDAPQLFESSIDVICDRIVSVTADEAVRVRRIMERDGISGEQAKERVSAQLSEDFFRAHSDDVIENNGGLAPFEQQLRELIQTIKTEVM